MTDLPKEHKGRKIFVSYKHEDSDVHALRSGEKSTARQYVDDIEKDLEPTNHIFKGEHDDNDLAAFSDEKIKSELRELIFDSTLTIVLISPNMVENKPEYKQFIPWEISYSLKDVRKQSDGARSKMNAILGVILPDKNNSYEYYSEGCLFPIIRKNTNNLKPGNDFKEKSYIKIVKWDQFKSNRDNYIEAAYEIHAKQYFFNIVRELEQ